MGYFESYHECSESYVFQILICGRTNIHKENKPRVKYVSVPSQFHDF